MFNIKKTKSIREMVITQKRIDNLYNFDYLKKVLVSKGKTNNSSFDFYYEYDFEDHYPFKNKSIFKLYSKFFDDLIAKQRNIKYYINLSNYNIQRERNFSRIKITMREATDCEEARRNRVRTIREHVKK